MEIRGGSKESGKEGGITGLCEGGVNPVGPGGEPDRVNRAGRALRVARGKQQAVLSQPG